MAEYAFKKLSAVPSELDFESDTSQHLIVEDGGAIKRMKPYTPLPPATSQDFGKLLGVDQIGNYELQRRVILEGAVLIIS